MIPDQSVIRGHFDGLQVPAVLAGPPPGLTTRRPRRVLIADDESQMRDLIARVLTRAGYITVRAVDGADAITCALRRSEPFDLLLTDLVMPHVRGTELARHLRLSQPSLRVLFFTGYRDQLFQEQQTWGQAEAVLEKPATPGAILEAVSRLLGERPVSAPQDPATPPSADGLLKRIRAEFREMPGLCLTETQASRLWGVDVRHCASALIALLDAGFLVRTRDGAFMKVS